MSHPQPLAHGFMTVNYGQRSLGTSLCGKLEFFHSNSSLSSPREFLEAKSSGSETDRFFSYSISRYGIIKLHITPSSGLSMTIVCTSLVTQCIKESHMLLWS